MSRIGILGGTFDPPHNGHLAIADAAMKQCDLNRLIFIPAKYPPHKLAAKVSSEMDRLNMLRAALGDKSEYEISDIELKRDGLSYTVDTMRELHEIYEADDLIFIIGSDNIQEMETWYKPDDIFKYGTVVSFNRPGYKPGGRFLSQIEMLEMDPVDISSSEIRDRYEHGGSIREMVPELVLQYIKEKSLYKER